MDERNAAQSTGYILRGLGREIDSVPDLDFLRAMKSLPERMTDRLAFMSKEHHLVRDFVVREMPREVRPIPAKAISQTLGIGLTRINEILTDLERNLFFLVRNRKGEVIWAYPVTLSRTAHRLTFSTGEKIFGA